MRKINTSDAFKAARLIKHAGIKDMILEKYKEGADLQDKSADATRRFGVEIVFQIIDSLAEARMEAEFYDLLGGILEKQNLAEQPLADTIEDIKAIFADNDMQAFFSSVSVLVGKN